MNKVILCGRLIKDVEVRTNNETVIAKFTLAVDRRIKKGEERKADFISCVAFGNLANFAEKYFHKGEGMTLEGRIQTGSFQAKDGRTVYTTDVIADSIEFPLGAKNNNSAPATNTNTNQASNGFMNIPDGIDEELPFR